VQSLPPFHDTPPPQGLAWDGLALAPTIAELEAEAHAAAEADPIARHELAYLKPELVAAAAVTRANLAAQEAEATRPLSPTEAAQAYEIAKAEADRLGYATVAEYLDVIDPIRPAGQPDPPESEAEYLAWLAHNGVTGEEAEAFRKVAIGTPFPEPEDRGTATLSALGDVEYVTDLIRPGRIVVVAAEEGAGKSYAVGGELAVRVAVAGGSFAGTWPVLRTGPVLYMSEMHADDDYGREATVLDSLGLERSALAGRYFRLPLMTAAGGRPALTVPEWRVWATQWTRDHAALLLIVDTATGATMVDPWGREIQAVYAALRVMLAEYRTRTSRSCSSST
jgi:AAA domain